MTGPFSGETSDQENPGEGGGCWYFSKKEIEENSPSRRDGVDLKKETYLRKSYCTFLQDLGMRLKVPQVTIATAIIFCHRFFLRQSHAKNERRIIATVCMFLASKVEETPRPLKDVILVSYEIIHKKDPAAVRRIKQKEVYEQQKELILLGERVLLVTLGFDLNVHHPYKPLVEAIKKFKVAQNALAQVAWNFVNDGLRTSLCLQFMPHHIAAGAIFLAAKFIRVKLPSDGEKVWWQEFDVTPRQLEEVSNQMLELYEQNRAPQSQASEVEGSVVGGSQQPSKGPDNDEHGATTSKRASSSQGLLKLNPNQKHAENHNETSRIRQARVGNGNSEINSTTDNKGDEDDDNDGHHHERALPRQRNSGEIQNKSRYGIEGPNEDDRLINTVGNETRDGSHVMEDQHQIKNLTNKDATVGKSPQDVNKKLDREKIKARFKQRKALGDISRKLDPVDEIERELEDVQVPGPSEKIKPERRQNWSKSSNKMENDNFHGKHANDSGDGHNRAMKGHYSNGDDLDTVEEGELEQFDDAEKGYKSPKSSSTRKRKPGEYPEDRNGFVRHGYSDRDYKRQQVQENHV